MKRWEPGDQAWHLWRGRIPQRVRVVGRTAKRIKVAGDYVGARAWWYVTEKHLRIRFATDLERTVWEALHGPLSPRYPRD